MSTAQQVDVGLLTESPPVHIVVIDPGETKKHNFYLHPVLLERCSPQFAARLKDKNLDDLRGAPAFETYMFYDIFKAFCIWLYLGRLTGELAFTTVHGLWYFARRWEVASLQKDIIDWVRQQCKNARDIMVLLRRLLRSCRDVKEDLPNYLLEKIAFEMTTTGYVNFIQAADGQFERFMSMKTHLAKRKKEYISELWLKVEEAGDLQSKGVLADPAIPI